METFFTVFLFGASVLALTGATYLLIYGDLWN
jgi:hypothetical protein